MIQEEEKASERGYCHTVQQAAFDVMRTTRAWLDKESPPEATMCLCDARQLESRLDLMPREAHVIV